MSDTKTWASHINHTNPDGSLNREGILYRDYGILNTWLTVASTGISEDWSSEELYQKISDMIAELCWALAL